MKWEWINLSRRKDEWQSESWHWVSTALLVIDDPIRDTMASMRSESNYRLFLSYFLKYRDPEPPRILSICSSYLNPKFANLTEPKMFNLAKEITQKSLLNEKWYILIWLGKLKSVRTFLRTVPSFLSPSEWTNYRKTDKSEHRNSCPSAHACCGREGGKNYHNLCI